MKYISSLLCFIPVLAYAGTAFEFGPESVKACYNTLQPSSAKEDVLSAITCLKNNPFVSESAVVNFSKEKAAVIGKYNQGPEAADINAALNSLSTQKKSRFYIAYESDREPKKVMVVEKSWLRIYRKSDGSPSIEPIYDLKATNAKLIEKSHIFSSDKTIDVKDISAFGYRGSERVSGIGQFVTIHKDGTKIVDKSYQGRFPLRIYDSKNNELGELSAFVGTTYGQQGKLKNVELRLDQENLSSFSIYFISEAEANQAIAEAEKITKEEEKAAAHSRQEAIKEVASFQKKISNNLAKMAKARIGTEDSCKRTDLNKYVVIKDPTAQDVNIECDFGGLVNLKGLKHAGWLVVNKQWREDVVTEYLIRKAR